MKNGQYIQNFIQTDKNTSYYFSNFKIWEGQTRTNKFFEEHYCKGTWDHSNDEKALKFVLNWQNK